MTKEQKEKRAKIMSELQASEYIDDKAVEKEIHEIMDRLKLAHRVRMRS